MIIKISTDVATEPIDTTYLKEYLNQLEAFATTETTLLNSMISAARELVEKETGKYLAAKTLVGWVSREEVELNDRYIELPGTPHSSITSVYSVDAEGTETLLVENTSYYVRGVQGTELEIYIPDVITSIGATINITDYKVTFVAGYGADGCEACPKALKTLMGTIISGWWGERDSWVPTLSQEMRAMCKPYKKVVF